jgi:hypothetical protein
VQPTFEVAECDLKEERQMTDSQTPNGYAVIPVERIEGRILLIRGERVILDSDLAELYGVTTARLNEQIRRNRDRFPEDFMFRLTRGEFNLISQFATSSSAWGGRRKLPYVFTEHGAIMAASVLNSARAVKASIYVVRAFVKLRQLLASHKELAEKFAELERRIGRHDREIVTLMAAIRALMEPAKPSRRPRIGFRPKSRK